MEGLNPVDVEEESFELKKLVNKKDFFACFSGLSSFRRKEN